MYFYQIPRVGKYLIHAFIFFPVSNLSCVKGTWSGIGEAVSNLTDLDLTLEIGLGLVGKTNHEMIC